MERKCKFTQATAQMAQRYAEMKKQPIGQPATAMSTPRGASSPSRTTRTTTTPAMATSSPLQQPTLILTNLSSSSSIHTPACLPPHTQGGNEAGDHAATPLNKQLNN